MTRLKLEEEFTSMLIHTGTQLAYSNLAKAYFIADSNNVILSKVDRGYKVLNLRKSEPKEWITKIFTEGLDIPPKLYQVNTLWLKHLEETCWE